MKRNLLVMVLILALIAAFASCALADEAQPQYGGHFVWSQPYEVGTFDPHAITDDGSTYLAWQVYEPLVSTDPYFNTIPALATSWEHPDKETYIFHLRHGAYWQDGNELWAEGEAPEVTAEDVVYSFKRALDPDNVLVVRSMVSLIDKVEALDKYTVRIHLSTPDILILKRGIPQVYIIPEELVENKLLMKHPIGSGPFEFVSYSPGEQVVFKKNEDYWMPVYLDGMTMRIIPEKQVAVMALEAGDIDYIAQVSPSAVPRLKEEGFLMVPRATGAYRYLAFNVKNLPWGNVKMREAIAHAINRDELIKVVFSEVPDLAKPAYQHESPGWSTYDPAMKKLPFWSYDMEKAKALLEEEGWVDNNGDGIRDKNGQKLSLEILTPSADPNREKIGVILTTKFKKELGIDATVISLEWGTYLDRTQVLPPKNDVQAYILGGYSNPKGLYSLFSSKTWGPGGNSAFYSNPNVDTLMESALTSSSSAEWVKKWKEAQVLIYKDLPHIPLYFEYSQGADKPTIHGCNLHHYGFNDTYRQVWMEQK